MKKSRLHTIKNILYTPIQLKFLQTNDTIQVMDRVDFIEQNEFHIKSRRIFGEPTTPSMISLLIKTGIAKTEKQALIILCSLIAIVLSVTISILIARHTPTSNVVVDQNGVSYTFQEYIGLVRQGKDPLLKQ